VNDDDEERLALPQCDACPRVEIDEHEVRIGEAGNLVKLTPAEWNVLVLAIKAGELTDIRPEAR
jgi:hypothetical protein